MPLLSGVMPRVVMVEEAGECLDSHTLATLPASVQHLILCGDHLQLRPSVSCFGEFSKRSSWDFLS